MLRKTMLWLSLVTIMMIGPAGSCDTHVQRERKSLQGHWEGAIVNQGAQLMFAVDFEEDANGLHATASCPDLLWYGVTLTAVNYQPPHLGFEAPSSPSRIVFDGKLDGNTITGNSQEGEHQIPFLLKRINTAIEASPYRKENVQFRDGAVTLSGTLLIPDQQEPHPALVFIHGAGEHRGEDYLVYANEFARRGIASLIYDKRGVGASTGNMRTADQRGLANDALAAVQFLKGRDDINVRQIGLWGHSLGGMVAPLAATLSDDVAFLILVSPPGVTLGEAEAWDDEFNLRKQGLPEDVIARSNDINRQLNEFLRTGQRQREVEKLLQDARGEKWFAYTDLPATVPSSRAASAYGGLDFDLDPLPILEKIRVPVLVIFGELDNRIPARKSAANIEQALKLSRSGDFTVKIFPGADHTIRLPIGQRSDTGGKWDWPRLAPGYLETMLDWTQTRLRQGLKNKSS